MSNRWYRTTVVGTGFTDERVLCAQVRPFTAPVDGVGAPRARSTTT